MFLLLLGSELLALLKIQPRTTALSRRQAGPLGHALLHALLLFRRQLVKMLCKLKPLGLARLLDGGPVTFQRSQCQALARCETGPTRAGSCCGPWGWRLTGCRLDLGRTRPGQRPAKRSNGACQNQPSAKAGSRAQECPGGNCHDQGARVRRRYSEKPGSP